MSRMIAGHDFSGGPLGNHCVLMKSGGKEGEICNRNLVDILSFGLPDVGKPDIAHYSTLNESEAKEIEKEKERIWEAMRHP
jgi:hypothetical protein